LVQTALTLPLKLREAPGAGVPVDPPLQIATETWDNDFLTEPNFAANPGKDPTCNEQVPDIAPNAPPNPISPAEAQRVRRAPPDVTGTGSRRTPFCAGSSRAQRVRRAPPDVTGTGSRRTPFARVPQARKGCGAHHHE
jgi:hypothetical protein